MTTKPYLFNLKELAEGKPPAFAAAGRPGENIPTYATLALAERVEALAAVNKKIEGHLALLVGTKMDALVEATKKLAP